MEIALNFKMEITDRSQVSEARYQVERITEGLQFNEVDAGSVTIMVTEMTKNLCKHASRGELIVQTIGFHGLLGIELLSLDKVPGMSNPSECLRDGYSTKGTPGTGLGALVRLATTFDVYTAAGNGTALLVRFLPKTMKTDIPPTEIELGALCLPQPGEGVSGDNWAVLNRQGTTLIMVSDGLGHGPLASEASREAVLAFRRNPHAPPVTMLEKIHLALRGTRGAAVAVAEVDWVRSVVRFAGVGNISGVIVTSGTERHMVSHYGIVGSQIRKIQEFDYPLPDGSVVILHSDGLSARWSLNAYPGLASRHPALIAAMLYRDCWRGTDDAAVVGVKRGRAVKPPLHD